MLPVRIRRNDQWVDPLDLIRQEVDRFVGPVLENIDLPAQLKGEYPVDITEEDGHYVIDAELPGFSKGDIDLSLHRGELTISAQRKHESKQKGDRIVHERRYTSVERTFTLSDVDDDAKVDAKLVDGVLQVRVPKRKDAKKGRHKIDIG